MLFIMFMLPPYINVKNFFSTRKPGWIGKDLLPSYYDVIDLSATYFFNDIVIDWIIIHKSCYILIIVLYALVPCYVTLMHSSRLKTMDIPTSSILTLCIKTASTTESIKNNIVCSPNTSPYACPSWALFDNSIMFRDQMFLQPEF